MPEQQTTLTLTRWVIAVLPLAALLALLVGLRWGAASAAAASYFLAVLAAVAFFGAPLRLVGLQTVKGVWDAVFVVYVIVPALFLYQVTRESGAFERLRTGIEAYTPNNLLHVLAFGWVFSTFLQGITGFGAPVAVTAPLLVAVGVRPLWAVAIPIIGHCWANTFGTLAVAWNGLLLITEPADPNTTALIAASMLWTTNLMAGFTISWLYGRMQGVREALPAVLLVSLIHGGGQLALVTVLPTLANFLPGAVAVGVIIWLGQSRWYENPSRVKVSQIMEEGEQEEQGRAVQQHARGRPQMSLFSAFLPYLVLLALIVLALLVPPVRQTLETAEVGLSFPELQTGQGYIVPAREAYSAFSPLTHPGTFLLVSAVVAFVVYRLQGHIREARLDNILVDTVRTSIPSAMALLALVPLAAVMEGAGLVQVLALGIASVAPAAVYVFLAPLMGSLGAFMTSSNLSIREAIILGAQTAGGAIGNSVAPGVVILGLGAVGAGGRAGDVIRRTLPFTLTAAVVAGVVALVALGLIGG
jgi:lactate permease